MKESKRKERKGKVTKREHEDIIKRVKKEKREKILKSYKLKYER